MQVQPRLFKEDAQSLFGRIESKSRACVERAERIWNNACTAEPFLRKAARGRGRNSIFNEIVAECAREAFDGEADVEVCEQYGTVRLHFQGRYDFGFKKIDGNGKFSNYLTPRRQRYNGQLPLFGDPLPDAVRLHFAYQWNNARTEIIDVYLAYPHQNSAIWKYPLRDGEADSGGAPVPMPKPKAPPSPAKFTSQQKRVKDDKDGGKANEGK